MIKYVPFEKFRKLEKRLRRIVRRGTEAQRRDALAVILGLHGLRVTEVCNLTVGDLDPINEMLRILTIKGGQNRKISLGDGVFRQLRKLAHKRPKSEPLLVARTGEPVYPTYWQRFARRITKQLFGGDGLNFHAMRHTHAIRLYHATKDLQRVRSRLGHKSLKNTDIYTMAYGQLDDERLERIGRITVLPSLARRRREREAAAKKSPRTQPIGRTSKAGERELFDTTAKPGRKEPAKVSEKTKKRREPEQKPRNWRAKNASDAKRRTKATHSQAKRSGERRRKSKK